MNKSLCVLLIILCFGACAAKSNQLQNNTSNVSKEIKSVNAQPEIANIEPKQIESNTQTVSVIKETSSSSQERTPLKVIQDYTNELRSIVYDEPIKQGQINKPKETKIANKVKQFFNFKELAKQSLGKHWAKTPSKKREKFSDLFTRLVEKSYLARSRSLMGNYELQFKNETISQTKSRVTSTVSRKDANIDITYELLKENNRWMIYNIILDDVDLIRNYQSQFNQIILKKGIDQLLTQMESKLSNNDDPKVNL